jgi:hypothetical protein
VHDAQLRGGGKKCLFGAQHCLREKAPGAHPRPHFFAGTIPGFVLKFPVSVAMELRLRRSWTPSIVPNGHDKTVYLVLDDFGGMGYAYRENDAERADLESVISNLINYIAQKASFDA